jgi:hypothetical protein
LFFELWFNFYFRGLIRTAGSLYATEGYWYGLMQPGLLASCSRELMYSSLRFAIYPHLRGMLRTDSHHLGFAAFGEKFCSGLIAGAIGSSLANPADLLKIRMQSEPGKIGSDGKFVRGPRSGQSRTYKSTADALKDILRKEGFRGLYRGVSATCMRSSLLTAGQLSSYDHTKQHLKATGYFTEGIPLHAISSVVSGLVASTCCAPADRIKTLMMVQSKNHPNFTFKQAFLHVNKHRSLYLCFNAHL